MKRWSSISLRLISSSPPRDNLFYDEDKKHAKRCRAMLEIAAKGQMAWQENHHYGKRALAELAMQRYKRTFGNQLHAREFSNQKMEMMLALNRPGYRGGSTF